MYKEVYRLERLKNGPVQLLRKLSKTERFRIILRSQIAEEAARALEETPVNALSSTERVILAQLLASLREDANVPDTESIEYASSRQAMNIHLTDAALRLLNRLGSDRYCMVFGSKALLNG